MSVFRIVFAKNEIISCKETTHDLLSDIPYYEHKNGQVIFALVKAENEEDATAKARTIAEQVEQSYGEEGEE